MEKGIFLSMFISFGLTFMFSGCSSDEATKVLESLTQNTASTANTQTVTIALLKLMMELLTPKLLV